MPADLGALLADLDAESAALRELVDPLRDSDWQLATPAPGWSIADQVSHLAYFDDLAVSAATRPEEFAAIRAGLIDGTENADTVAARYRQLTPAELRDWFGRARTRLLTAFAGLDPAARVPWFGPPMSVASSVTARLMETWAHGQDIADTIGSRREPTARLRHVAHIGVAALPYSYAAHGLPVPAEPVRVELTAPSGEIWTWGSDGARDRISGPALDFCLLVTQRRHLADTAMVAVGPVADQWLSIAQSFAGPPGAGRLPGQFAR
jgi:uncharacterized protein (TIGR03084 family)